MKIDGGPMYMFESLIDVPVSCVAPAASAAIILFASKIGTGASQQLRGSSETVSSFQVRIHARVIVEIFSVDDGGPVDFSNGRVHFMIGFDQIARHIRLLPDAQQELSRT